jgi:hypothetical protein
MAGTPKILAQFLIASTGDAQLAVVPANKRWVISMLHIANSDSSQRTVRLNHCLLGAGVAVLNRIVPDSALPSGDFMEFWGGAVMNATDELRGLADAANVVSGTLYGIEESV